MKRTLAIALSTLALAATGAQATTQAPQPSFVDYPTVEANLPVRATTERNVKQTLPQPSFIDYAAIDAEQASTGSSAGHTLMAGEGFPKPSFAN